MNKLQYVEALRELATFVESHEFPDQIQGWGNGQDTFDCPNLRFYARNKVDFGTLCLAMGSFEKTYDAYSTGAKATLPSGVEISVSTARELVCKRIVTGTRIVEAKPEEIIPAEPEREEEIVTWECPESFVALAKGSQE